jgi:hypothetical protein
MESQTAPYCLAEFDRKRERMNISLEDLQVLITCVGAFIAIGFGIVAILGTRELTK